MISDNQFLALFPLYTLAKQHAENGNPNFDWSMSREDFLNGKNGIPQSAGMKIVFQLLLMSGGDLIETSANEQSFRITPKGFASVVEYAAEKKALASQ